jgi:hypothetical protein
MRSTRPLALFVMFVFRLGILLCAAPQAAFLELDPGFSELAALIEPIDNAKLERAALLASGVPPGRLSQYESRLNAILGELKAEAGKAAGTTAVTAAATAEAVLTFLHTSIFRGYREDATTLDGILDSGRYNCVSSAVLYAIAARSLGIETAGVRTQDHAFCTVYVGGRSIDVETTNPYGFDPGGKKEFKDSFGRATGYAYVAPGGYGDRKAIGVGDLVGLILTNRASSLDRAGRFVEAAKLGADYAALCPGLDSRSFLVDRINNLVADLEGRRKYLEAEEAATAASAALPGESRLADLAKTASYNRAAALAQTGDWAAAFDAGILLAGASPGDGAVASLVANSLSGLAQSYARKGDFGTARRAIAERAALAGPAAAAAANALVGEMELVRAANALPLAEAAATVDRIYAAREVSAARYAQAMTTIYGNEAQRIGSTGDWLGGAALAELGASKAGAAAPVDGSLARLAQALRGNYVAEAHNRFARLYNSGDFAGAKAALIAALSAPDAAIKKDATLLGDLAAAEAAMAKKK